MGKSSFKNLVHLLVLSGFAIGQPLFDILGKHPEFLVAHNAGPWEIIELTVFLAFATGTLLFLLELLLLIISQRAMDGVHYLFVLFLSCLTILSLMTKLDWPAQFVIGLASVLAIVFVAAYIKWQPVGMTVTLLAPAVFVFPVMFLLTTPINNLVVNSKTQHKNYQNTKTPLPLPVVLIVFDELHTGALLDASEQIDAIRFPAFAALAGDSYWYPNAVSPNTETAHSIPAIITGRKPTSAGGASPTAANHPDSLITLLGQEFQLNVWEHITNLCPDSLCPKSSSARSGVNFLSMLDDVVIVYGHLISPARVEKYLPSLDAQWTGFGKKILSSLWPIQDPASSGSSGDARSVFEKNAIGFSDRFEDSPLESFHFLHLMVPHIPYSYLSSGHQYTPSDNFPSPEGYTNHEWSEADELRVTAYHQYLQQVGYADRLLGMILSRLESSGLYDDALIIITADHGVAFEAGYGRRYGSREMVREYFKVPLFVKIPGQKYAQVDERLASGLDIVPTVADVLNIEIPWKTSGSSLFGSADNARQKIELPLRSKEGKSEWFSAEEIRGFPVIPWQVAHFGQHTSLLGLTQDLQYSELLGRSASDLQFVDDVNVSVESPDVGDFMNVSLFSGYLPALLRGRIVEGLKEVDIVAIALNGKIQGVTKVVPWDGVDGYFSLLLPPNIFVDGDNKLQVLVRTKDASFVRANINVDSFVEDARAAQVRLEHNILYLGNGKEVVVGSARGGTMHGDLSLVEKRGAFVRFTGWAVDLVANRPASRILIFSAGRLMAEGKTWLKFAEVAEAFKADSLMASGFDFGFRITGSSDKLRDVRVIATSDRADAIELKLSNSQRLKLGLPLLSEPSEATTQSIDGGTELTSTPSKLQVEKIHLANDVLFLGDDKKIAVDNIRGEVMRGDISSLEKDGVTVRLIGWAVNLAADKPADRIMIFSAGRLVAIDKARLDFDEVAEVFNSRSLLTSGFDLTFRSESVGSLDNVRIIATFNDTDAVELNLSELQRKILGR